MPLGTAGEVGGQDASWDGEAAVLGLGSEPTPPHPQHARKWYRMCTGAVGSKFFGATGVWI